MRGCLAQQTETLFALVSPFLPTPLSFLSLCPSLGQGLCGVFPDDARGFLTYLFLVKVIPEEETQELKGESQELIKAPSRSFWEGKPRAGTGLDGD